MFVSISCGMPKAEGYLTFIWTFLISEGCQRMPTFTLRPTIERDTSDTISEAYPTRKDRRTVG